MPTIKFVYKIDGIEDVLFCSASIAAGPDRPAVSSPLTANLTKKK
jgi:hypothetical protein